MGGVAISRKKHLRQQVGLELTLDLLPQETTSICDGMAHTYHESVQLGEQPEHARITPWTMACTCLAKHDFHLDLQLACLGAMHEV